MYHNLTERQLKALRWIVQQVKARQLEETFMIMYMNPDVTNIRGFTGSIPEYVEDDDTLYALVVSGVLIGKNPSNSVRKYTLTRIAYEIADFDFFNPDPDPLLAYIKETHHLIQRHFNKDELSRVSFELGINDWAFGDNPDRPFELLLYLYRQNRLQELEPILQEQRPTVSWPPFPAKDGNK